MGELNLTYVSCSVCGGEVDRLYQIGVKDGEPFICHGCWTFQRRLAWSNSLAMKQCRSSVSNKNSPPSTKEDGLSTTQA